MALEAVDPALSCIPWGPSQGFCCPGPNGREEQMEGRNGHCRLYRGLVTVPAPFWNPLQESGRSSSHLRVTITVTVLLPLDRTLFPRPVPTPSVCGVTGGAGSLAWCHPCPRRPTPAPRSLSGHRSCRQAGGGGGTEMVSAPHSGWWSSRSGHSTIGASLGITLLSCRIG